MMNPIATISILSITLLITLYWNVLVGEKIIHFLLNDSSYVKTRLKHINPVFIAKKYRKITTEAEGKVGELYHPFVISAIMFIFLLTTLLIMLTLFLSDTIQ